MQSFANTDATTLEYISRGLGDLPLVDLKPTNITASGAMSGGMTTRIETRNAPLLAPFEVALYTSRESGRQIVRLAGRPPAYLERITHQEVKNLGKI